MTIKNLIKKIDSKLKGKGVYYFEDKEGKIKIDYNFLFDYKLIQKIITYVRFKIEDKVYNKVEIEILKKLENKLLEYYDEEIGCNSGYYILMNALAYSEED